MKKIRLNLVPPSENLGSPLSLERFRTRIIACVNSFTTYELLFGKMSRLDLSKFEFLIDGFPVYILLKCKFPRKYFQRIPGPDFASKLIANLPKSTRIGLIGGDAVSSKLASRELMRLGFEIRTYSDEVTTDDIQSATSSMTKAWGSFVPDILLICLGQPKQEMFALKIAEIYPESAILCVGAFVDLLSTVQPRSPSFLRVVGMEWFWRLLHEPKRLWRRYLVNSPIGLMCFLVKVEVSTK